MSKDVAFEEKVRQISNKESSGEVSRDVVHIRHETKRKITMGKFFSCGNNWTSPHLANTTFFHIFYYFNDIIYVELVLNDHNVIGDNICAFWKVFGTIFYDYGRSITQEKAGNCSTTMYSFGKYCSAPNSSWKMFCNYPRYGNRQVGDDYRGS